VRDIIDQEKFDAVAEDIVCRADRYGARVWTLDLGDTKVRILSHDEALAARVVSRLADEEIPEDLLDPDEEVECWCGAKGHASEMFQSVGGGCGGLGGLDCHCGGDLCVCHNHGEVECPGCDECQDSDGEDYE
jgi:hypothetical protein